MEGIFNTITIPLERYDELIIAEERLRLILASGDKYVTMDRGLIDLLRGLSADEEAGDA